MRSLALAFLVTTAAFGQDKVYLYPSTQKSTIDGFDKEPPFMEFFKADAAVANKTTILVVPGGGYTHLAVDHEGKQIAAFYNKHGFDCWVLQYRLNDGQLKGHKHPAQYNDVTTAIRIVKSKAKDPEKVGIIGFSAGGHLSSMCATMHIPADKTSKDPIQQYSSRPAFAMLIYPVITFSDDYAHKGSRKMLLGENPDKKMIDSLSTQNRVNKNTPPTFIIYSTDDKTVPVENGILFYQALVRNNVKASLHVFDHGGHGYGLSKADATVGTWGEMSVGWIKDLGFK